jgi:membrane associated rhomboid family serine protease
MTIALLAANLASFTFFSRVDEVREQRLAQRGLTALVYFQQHPYLALKAPLSEFVERNPSSHAGQTAIPGLAEIGQLATRDVNRPVPVDRVLIRQQQAELDGKVSAFARVADEWNATSFGYVPCAGNFPALITYQFMHGSWTHLLGNLFFLWLIGSQLERAWGRTLLGVFYVAAGVAAAGTHQLLAWQSAVPLIGASGAIAGLLGAFTLWHAKAGLLLTLSRSLGWKAWRCRGPLLVLIWFALELTQALVLPRREGTAAHFAHVGGFVFGLLCAWVVRSIRLGRPRGGAIQSASA